MGAHRGAHFICAAAALAAGRVSAGAGLLESRHGLSSTCPQVAPAQLRDTRRAGARGACPDPRAVHRPPAPRLSVHRHPRGRQDHHLAHPRQGPQLRDRRHPDAVQPVRGLHRDRRRPLPDYVEMDAASNRGVDDMAALLDQAVYAPVQGRYKVYMIDEVHMLTGHAFNAMLKTLEEPPEHVKFIIATTDPQKIPVTVLSRCLQFNLKQMPPGHIVGHLTRLLEAEAVPFEPGALRHIAKAASGSMRDSLSLLDQAIAHGAGKVEEQAVQDMLGTVGDDHLYAVLDALRANDVQALMGAVDGMEARSLSFESALQALASLLHRIALAQLAPAAIADEFEAARLAPYVEAFDAEFLQLAYQIAIHGRDELPLAPTRPPASR
jgi:DNA polymerase III subunit gamma/tau